MIDKNHIPLFMKRDLIPIGEVIGFTFLIEENNHIYNSNFLWSDLISTISMVENLLDIEDLPNQVFWEFQDIPVRYLGKHGEKTVLITPLFY